MVITSKEIADELKDSGFSVSEGEVKQVVQLFFPAHIIKAMYIELTEGELMIIKGMLTKK